MQFIQWSLHDIWLRYLDQSKPRFLKSFGACTDWLICFVHEYLENDGKQSDKPTADPCSVTADPCSVTADPCSVTADPCIVMADPCSVTADPCSVTADRVV